MTPILRPTSGLTLTAALLIVSSARAQNPNGNGCGQPSAPPYQINNSGCTPTISTHHPFGAPGPANLYIGGTGVGQRVVLWISPSLVSGAPNGSWLSPTGRFRISAPYWRTGPDHYLVVGVGWPLSTLYYCEASVETSPGVWARSPVRQLANDVRCYNYETFDGYAPGAFQPVGTSWWTPWANGATVVDLLGGCNPAKELKLEGAQGSPGNPACNAGGAAVDFKNTAGHGFSLDVSFAIDQTPISQWNTCHNFTFKVMLTAGLTTTGAHTIFEVRDDSGTPAYDPTLIIYDPTSNATINTGIVMGTVDANGLGSWYGANITYNQITPGAGNTNKGIFNVEIRELCSGTPVYSLSPNGQLVTLAQAPDNCALTRVMFETGGPPCYIDEVSLQN